MKRLALYRGMPLYPLSKGRYIFPTKVYGSDISRLPNDLIDAKRLVWATTSKDWAMCFAIFKDIKTFSQDYNEKGSAIIRVRGNDLNSLVNNSGFIIELAPKNFIKVGDIDYASVQKEKPIGNIKKKYTLNEILEAWKSSKIEIMPMNENEFDKYCRVK